jgi:hypothetical protein
MLVLQIIGNNRKTPNIESRVMQTSDTSWYDSVLSVIIALIIWRKRILKMGLILRVVRSFVSIFTREKPQEENFMEVMSFENLKKAVSVAAKVGNIAGKTFEDGKLSMADLALLPEFITLFPAFIAVEWTKVVPTAKELTTEQIAELMALFSSEFDIPQDKLEQTIEAVLGIVSQLVGVIANLIAIFKKPAV